MTYSKIPEFVYNGIRLQLGLVKEVKLEGQKGMNPFEYWYDTNSEIFTGLKMYYKENIDRIKDPGIRMDCETLFQQGSLHEKAQVITLLSAVKLFFT